MELAKITDDMMKTLPSFLPGLGSVNMTDKEKVTTLIEMHTNMLVNNETTASFEYAVGHVEGLILGCDMSKMITKKEAEDFRGKVTAKRREFDK